MRAPKFLSVEVEDGTEYQCPVSDERCPHCWVLAVVEYPAPVVAEQYTKHNHRCASEFGGCGETWWRG